MSLFSKMSNNYLNGYEKFYFWQAQCLKNKASLGL